MLKRKVNPFVRLVLKRAEDHLPVISELGRTAGRTMKNREKPYGRSAVCACRRRLRSRGRALDYAGVVISVGDVSDYRYIGDGSVAVRPAVRLAL